MANMADITTAAASDPGSPRESAPPPRGRASPSPSLPPSFLSLPLPRLPTHSLRGAAGPRERAQPRAAPGEGAVAALRSAARAFAVWQVPGAQVNPRPRACASASAAPTPCSLGAPEDGAGQNTAALSSANVQKSVSAKGKCQPEPQLPHRASSYKELISKAPQAPANSHPPIRTSLSGAKGPFLLPTPRRADLPGLSRRENAYAVPALFPASSL